MRGHPHATVQPLHLTQLQYVQWFFSTGEGGVNLFLYARIRLRVEQEVVEDGGEDAACCVRTSNDG
jgi:hypothetical protein